MKQYIIIKSDTWNEGYSDENTLMVCTTFERAILAAQSMIGKMFLNMCGDMNIDKEGTLSAVETYMQKYKYIDSIDDGDSFQCGYYFDDIAFEIYEREAI